MHRYLQVGLRDLFWAILVAALAIGWWTHSWQMSHENRLKLWGFDIAASVLEERTGIKMTVDQDGVVLFDPQNQRMDRYSF